MTEVPVFVLDFKPTPRCNPQFLATWLFYIMAAYFFKISKGLSVIQVYLTYIT